MGRAYSDGLIGFPGLSGLCASGFVFILISKMLALCAPSAQLGARLGDLDRRRAPLIPVRHSSHRFSRQCEFTILCEERGQRASRFTREAGNIKGRPSIASLPLIFPSFLEALRGRCRSYSNIIIISQLLVPRQLDRRQWSLSLRLRLVYSGLAFA